MSRQEIEFTEYEDGRKHKWRLCVGADNRIKVSSYYFIDRETYMDPNSGRILKRYEHHFPKKSDIPLSEVPKVEEMREKALNCLRARITL